MCNKNNEHGFSSILEGRCVTDKPTHIKVKSTVYFLANIYPFLVRNLTLKVKCLNTKKP